NIVGGQTEVGGEIVIDCNLFITNGAVLSHHPGQTNTHLTIAGDLLIDSSGAIILNGKGYGERQGPGAGRAKPQSTCASGGGYGSAGGLSCDGAPGGGSYGSASQPTDLGSGGGKPLGGSGGRGGGAIHLTVAGKILLDGLIAANGAPTSGSGGGGS